jgi:hypothetical protein
MAYNFSVSQLGVFSYFLISFLLASGAEAAGESDLDPILADTLKIEANHNINRLRSLRAEKRNNQVFENEREKGLGEFLEDQEKWDLVRERGLSEYRREKKLYRSPVEGGLDFYEDSRKKRQADYLYEQSREIHARTKRKIESQFRFDVESLEMQELGLNEKLPRYDLRRRSQNKWVNSAGRGSGAPFSGGGGSFQNTPAPVEFPPAPDFPPAPAPYEGYDENLQPPPMDSSGGVPYDPSFGTDMSIPPPPPPPPDYDF